MMVKRYMKRPTPRETPMTVELAEALSVEISRFDRATRQAIKSAASRVTIGEESTVKKHADVEMKKVEALLRRLNGVGILIVSDTTLAVFAQTKKLYDVKATFLNTGWPLSDEFKNVKGLSQEALTKASEASASGHIIDFYSISLDDVRADKRVPRFKERWRTRDLLDTRAKDRFERLNHLKLFDKKRTLDLSRDLGEQLTGVTDTFNLEYECDSGTLVLPYIANNVRMSSSNPIS